MPQPESYSSFFSLITRSRPSENRVDINTVEMRNLRQISTLCVTVENNEVDGTHSAHQLHAMKKNNKVKADG
jgi:hypothetical protein